MTERDKMGQSLWYDANNDAELLALRTQADDLCHQFNQTAPSDEGRRAEILKRLLPACGERTTILAPLYVDYGCNCIIGGDSFINHGAYLMDGATITIGSHCFIGPNCGMYTAEHPLVAEERNQGLERARAIHIGDNVWIGGNVTILAGVTIGEEAVIGAGSVVTKDIPAHMVAVGNPCRAIRAITEQDCVTRSEDQ